MADVWSQQLRENTQMIRTMKMLWKRSQLKSIAPSPVDWVAASAECLGVRPYHPSLPYPPCLLVLSGCWVGCLCSVRVLCPGMLVGSCSAEPGFVASVLCLSEQPWLKHREHHMTITSGTKHIHTKLIQNTLFLKRLKVVFHVHVDVSTHLVVPRHCHFHSRSSSWPRWSPERSSSVSGRQPDHRSWTPQLDPPRLESGEKKADLQKKTKKPQHFIYKTLFKKQCPVLKGASNTQTLSDPERVDWGPACSHHAPGSPALPVGPCP